MKKIILLLFVMILGMGANAQLTAKQVFSKANTALDLSKGIQGNAKIKMMGVGGPITFETDGNNNFRIYDDGDIYYINQGVSYEYDSAKNTITLEDGELTYVTIFPYQFVKSLETGKLKWGDFKNVEMERKDSDYVITMKHDSGKYAFTIDGKSFLIKEAKIKKGLVTLMSVTYTNLSQYKGTHSVIFDKSKYPNAKIIDKRKKKS